MSEKTETITERDGLRMEIFKDENDLFRGRILSICEGEESIIFTGSKDYDFKDSAIGDIHRVQDEMTHDIESCLVKTNDKLLKLTREYDIVKRDYRKSQTALKEVGTRYDVSAKTVRILEATIREYESRVVYLERKRQANLDYAANCQGWAITGWCVAAILLGFCLFI